MTLPAATRPSGVLARSAFSLIELLVVITIIAVVIAITVPALAGARELARKSSTEGTVNSLVQATAQFTTDEQRAPGYFSPEEMGHADNVDRGFSSMQNIMLELVGGPVEASGLNTNLPRVGPMRNSQIYVDPALINVGDNSKGYYTPGAKDYKPAEGAESIADHKLLPEVLDAWGMPILAWVENDIGTVMNDSAVIDDFAQIKAGDASEPARFYWAQNSAALSSAALGQRQIDQANESLLGSEVADMERQDHLTAFLGSPNSSVNSDAAYRAILPRVGRGAVVFQSAGTDRVYLSKDDNGYNRLGGNFYFGRNLTPVASVNAGQYERPDGTKGSIDIVEGFDDIVTASGN